MPTLPATDATHVTMTHPVHGEWDCPRDYVPTAEEKGWSIAGGDTPAPTTAAVFDPGTHTVDEVNAYLDGADDAERDRVLAAEKAGKNRSGITGY